MRILGFSKKFNKLNQDVFTTFRFPRRDRDWEEGEQVQVVFKPRSKDRELLGWAIIVGKVKRRMSKHYDETGEILVTNQEAEEDGFSGTLAKPAYFNMWEFLWDFYGGERLQKEPMNKLTLKWVESP